MSDDVNYVLNIQSAFDKAASVLIEIKEILILLSYYINFYERTVYYDPNYDRIPFWIK